MQARLSKQRHRCRTHMGERANSNGEKKDKKIMESHGIHVLENYREREEYLKLKKLSYRVSLSARNNLDKTGCCYNKKGRWMKKISTRRGRST